MAMKKLMATLIRVNWKTLVPLGILLVLFVTNAFHEKYPDEFDSIVGGKYILEGRIPYRDWFQHHQPGAYVVAAGIQLFTGQSFVKFRVGLAMFWFVFAVTTFLLFKKRIWLLFLCVSAFGATYWWGHMLLADTFLSTR